MFKDKDTSDTVKDDRKCKYIVTGDDKEERPDESNHKNAPFKE